MAYDVVLVAVDPDFHGERIVREAMRLAAALGARLELLHVIPLGRNVSPDVLRNPKAHPGVAAELKEREDAVAPALRRLAGLARHAAPVRVHVAHGEPVDVIVHTADALDASLVVLGTHARRGLLRVALGSVAEGVLRTSPVPVATIATPDDEATGPAGGLREIPLDAPETDG